jgi:hypothetical protein
MSRRFTTLYGCALAGAALIALGGRLYRVDTMHCPAWPPLAVGLGYAPLYLLALGILAVSWIGLNREVSRLPLGRLLLVALPVHLVAMIGLPFLSDDGLAYAAVGRAQALYHAGAFTPLGESLPLGDPFRLAISRYDAWLAGGSAYSVGFNALAWAVARLGGDDLLLQLRLYQLVGLGATLAAAALTARAAETVEPGSGSRAAQLVLFSPLALVEASVNLHNDALLMVVVALFALCVAKERPGWAFVVLGLGLLIKASGLLMLGFFGLHLLLVRLRTRFGPRGLVALALGAALIAVAAVALAWPLLTRYAYSAASLFGSPSDAYPFCTRSIECLPRGLLHLVLGQRQAAWLLGLVFRVAAGVFVVLMAARAPAGRRHLEGAAAFLFLYYLYLHAFSQPWYLLALLPLLPFATPRLRPAIIAACLGNLAHYALDFPWNCDMRPVVVGATELVQGLIVLVPPTWILLRRPRAAALP